MPTKQEVQALEDFVHGIGDFGSTGVKGKLVLGRKGIGK